MRYGGVVGGLVSLICAVEKRCPPEEPHRIPFPRVGIGSTLTVSARAPDETSSFLKSTPNEAESAALECAGVESKAA